MTFQGLSEAQARRFRMALLSGEVETRAQAPSEEGGGGPFWMALLSGEVETSKGPQIGSRPSVSVPDGFAIRGS